MEKKPFERPVIYVVNIVADEIICSSGPEPVDKIVKSDSAFGFDASEII